MKFRVTHATRYRYSGPVVSCYNVARLRPRATNQQRCLAAAISIDPTPSRSYRWDDLYGNHTDYFTIQDRHKALTVTAVSEVEIVSAGTLLESAFPIAWEQARDYLRSAVDESALDARQYCLESPLIDLDGEMAAYAEPSFTAGLPLLTAVEDLMGRIHRDFSYDPTFTNIATPLKEVLAHRRGVCQDFAHLAIACLRSQSLAARYISGYLETLPPPGAEKLTGADASHAWFSVYVPDQGWVDFDPTNDQVPADRHITTAWGRDYADVAPLKGVLFGGGESHEMQVSVDVARVAEGP